MSTTEEPVEAMDDKKEGTATVNIKGITHKFTLVSEAAAQVETVEPVSRHAKQRGTAVRALMHDDQGSCPVKR